jgi:hypothetical protein
VRDAVESIEALHPQPDETYTLLKAFLLGQA